MCILMGGKKKCKIHKKNFIFRPVHSFTICRHNVMPEGVYYCPLHNGRQVAAPATVGIIVMPERRVLLSAALMGGRLPPLRWLA